MSDKAQSLFDEAMQANLAGNTSRAADLLKQAVELDPENVDAWVELAKLLTDRDERRMALTTIINLDPDNSYAKSELESVEKPKSAVDENAEIVPGIPRKQARMIGLGLAGYTLVVCMVTLLITSAINGNKAAAAERVAQLYNAQTSTQDTIYQVGTQSVLTATQSAVDANATLLALNSPTPTATSTRSFVLPTEILPTETPTQLSFRILDLPPALSGQILAWGGLDVRSKEYLSLRSYPLSQPGQFSKLNSELGKNPIMSADGSITAFEQWRSDGTRLYMNVLEPVTPGGTLDALISSSYLVIDLRDPSLSRDAKRIAFIATDYNTKAVEPYVADLTNLMSPKFYKLNQDTASYTGITLSPDGNTAVAVRYDGTTTDQ